MKYLRGVLSILLVVLVSCGVPKEENVDYESRGLDVPFPEENLEALRQVPETNYGLDEIVLPNGKTVKAFLEEFDLPVIPDPNVESQLTALAAEAGPQAQKNLVIGRMAQLAYFLTNRSNFVFSEEAPQGGVLRPAQNGLGYSFGGKNYQTRAVPPAGECKKAAIYGLDCSGFIFQIAKNAGLNIPVGTASRQSQPSTWEEAFGNAGLDKLKAEQLGQLPTADFETGDIIYWYSGSGIYHIGIVLKTSGGALAVFQSNGSSDTNCESNYGPSRGPRQLSLNDPYWFSGKAGRWGITRFVTDIASEWQVFGRCQGFTNDAFNLTIGINSDEQQNVTASGSGTDYDGKPLAVGMEGTYDQVANNLAAKITFTFPTLPGEKRIDSFERRLNEDDTSYFPAVLEFHSSQGCTLELRLVNQDKSPIPPVAINLPQKRRLGFISE